VVVDLIVHVTANRQEVLVCAVVLRVWIDAPRIRLELRLSQIRSRITFRLQIARRQRNLQIRRDIRRPTTGERAALRRTMRTATTRAENLSGEIDLLCVAQRRAISGLQINGVVGAERQIRLSVVATLARLDIDQAAAIVVAV